MEDILCLADVSKTYENGNEALKGISLRVKQGDFFALLGPNGAGKSTTLGIISNLVKKTSGTITVNGYDLDTHPIQLRRHLGIVPQEFNFSIFETLEQTLICQGGYYGLSLRESRKRADKYLELLGLRDKKREQIRQLSGGMKRRAMISRALIHEPSLLVLDEPTAGVDIESRRHMWKTLKTLNANGTTIILTTHYLEEAQQLCQNIAIINHGRVIADTSMKELLYQLDSTPFLIEFRSPPELLRNLSVDFEPVDEHTIKVTSSHKQDLNQILRDLLANQVELENIQPEANRLESLFFQLTRNDLNSNQ